MTRAPAGDRVGGALRVQLARLGWWWLPALVMAGGIVAVTIGRLRIGGYGIAAALLVAALIRLVARGNRAGGIAVRGRALDVIMLLGLAIAVAVAVSLVRGLG